MVNCFFCTYIFRPHCSNIQMWPDATDRVAWSICLSVSTVSPAKTAEPVEMPFGLLTRVVSKNRVRWKYRSPHMKGNVEGKKGPGPDIPGHVWQSICSK